MRYVYHPGTGTAIALDECVLLEVSDETEEAIARGDTDYSDCEAQEGNLFFIVGEYLNQHGWPTEVE